MTLLTASLVVTKQVEVDQPLPLTPEQLETYRHQLRLLLALEATRSCLEDHVNMRVKSDGGSCSVEEAQRLKII